MNDEHDRAPHPAPPGAPAGRPAVASGAGHAPNGWERREHPATEEGTRHEPERGTPCSSAHEHEQHAAPGDALKHQQHTPDAGVHGHEHGPEQHAVPAGVHGHDGAHEHEHEHHSGFVHVFRERAISLRTMERPLRLITGLAIAQLVVTALLLATRTVPLPGFAASISLFVSDGHLVQMPLVVFLLSLLFVALSWSYLLAGALHAHPLVRLLGLATYTWAMLTMRDVAVTAGAGLPATAVLVAVWLVGLATWVLDRRAERRGATEQSHRRRLWMLTFGLIFLLVVAQYAITWWSVRGIGEMLFPSALTIQLDSLQYALVVVLFLAGTDFAEWGQVTGERVAEVVGRARARLPLLAAVTAATAVAILVAAAVQYHGETWHQLVLGALLLGLLALLAQGMRFAQKLPLHVPYAALALGAVVYVGVGEGGATLETMLQAGKPAPARPFAAGPLTVYRHDRLQPHFSLAYPATWEVLPLLDKGPRSPTIIGFSGLHAAAPATLWLVGSTVAGEKNLATLQRDYFAALFKPYARHVTATSTHGPWQVTMLLLTALRGSGRLQNIVWERRTGERLWLLNGQAPPWAFKAILPTFTTMVDSWTPSLAPVRAPSGEGSAAGSAGQSGDPLLADVTAFWLVITLLGAAALLVGARRRRSGALAAGGLFLVVAGLLIVFSGYPQFRLVYALPFIPPGQKLGLVGVQVAVAAATLLVLAWLAATRRLTARWARPLALLLTLNIGLQIVSWVFDLYTSAMDLGGRFTVAQAVVILLALLWDVTMSGETITNVRGRLFPRHARVLLFLGYVMLVAANLLYFSSLQVQATGAGVESQFESEMWPQSGVLFLGAPLLLTLCVLGLGRWRAQSAAQPLSEETGEHGHDGAQAVSRPAALLPAADA